MKKNSISLLKMVKNGDDRLVLVDKYIFALEDNCQYPGSFHGRNSSKELRRD